ncbi:hypothetical protein J2M53_09235 [Arthrobacter sp. zg-ZUI100]|uniref:hypothetical protein n=1 Tax=Arthrobacter jiangjiafuii TaxID=2817475 RepID=UPI001AEDBEF5|nr:hypothetical protein [Arthrobacter jiangjiafuii]MBP3036437.1 hypothetical protein [Arthrobacter jiangjiafuii]
MTTPSKPLTRRSARTVQKAGLVIGMLISAFTTLLCLGTAAAAVIMPMTGQVELTLPAAPIPDAAWADLSPKIVSAASESFQLSLQNVESEGLTMWSATMGISCAVVALITAFVGYLCLRVYKGQPFGRLMTVGFAVSSAVIVAGSAILPSVFAGVNERIISDAGIDLATAPFTGGYVFGAADAAFLLFGIFLALVAAAFHIGSRLQRDGEGLV